MTLPKGYVIPNKDAAEEKAKKDAAEEKAKKDAAEEKAKKDAAEEKSNLQNSSNEPSNSVKVTSHISKGSQPDSDVVKENEIFNYYMLWEQLKEAYIDTFKEATSSYLRLLDFWSQSYKK